MNVLPILADSYIHELFHALLISFSMFCEMFVLYDAP
jgi:hypothetical protein